METAREKDEANHPFRKAVEVLPDIKFWDELITQVGSLLLQAWLRGLC